MRFPPLTPLVKRLLIVAIGAYVALVIAVNWLGMGAMARELMLSPTVGMGVFWQPLTFPLVQPTGPDGMFGFLVAAVFFWWIVAPFESTFGARHTATLLFVTSLASSAAVLVAGTLMALIADPVSPFLGTGPLFGFGVHILSALSAFAWSMRNKGDLNFFGVLPMKAKTFIYLALAWSVLHFLTSRDLTNLVADLAAVGIGIAFIERLSQPPKAKRKSRKSGAKLRVLEGGRSNEDEPPKWLN